MNTITFPLLKLELSINKTAFNIFGIPIYWYAILIIASIAIALIFSKIQDGKFGIKFEDILDLSIILIPISFISARLYYVIFNIKQYTSIIEIINIKDGGLAIYGGIIGGIITTYIFCKKRKINTLDLTDFIAPFLALGQSIGRWGNFINVEAYGIQTNLPWKMGIETSKRNNLRTSNISIRINMYPNNIHNPKQNIKKQKIYRTNNLLLYSNVLFHKSNNRNTKNRQSNVL